MTGRYRTIGWTLGGVLAGLLAGVLAMAWLNPAPDPAAIANATKEPLITAPVELRPARQAAQFPAQLKEAATVGVNPIAAGEGQRPGSSPDGAGRAPSAPALPETLRQVVSVQPHRSGDRVSVGQLLAEVSGRPVFAFPASAPLYRDLIVGTRGPDVTALQETLMAAGFLNSADGVFGQATLSALEKLYRRHGHAAPEVMPGQRGLRIAETAQLPAATVQITALCPVGSVPTADNPLLSVRASAPVLSGRIDVTQVDAFPAGAPVQVQAGNAPPGPSTVSAVAGFQEASDGVPAGYPIVVAVPDGFAPTPGEPITVTEAATPQQAPGVPASAIRYDAGTSYVLKADAGATTRVPVDVVGQSGGFAVLKPSPELPVGSHVVVSGR